MRHCRCSISLLAWNGYWRPLDLISSPYSCCWTVFSILHLTTVVILTLITDISNAYFDSDTGAFVVGYFLSLSISCWITLYSLVCVNRQVTLTISQWLELSVNRSVDLNFTIDFWCLGADPRGFKGVYGNQSKFQGKMRKQTATIWNMYYVSVMLNTVLRSSWRSWRQHPSLFERDCTAGLIFARLQPGKKGKKSRFARIMFGYTLKENAPFTFLRKTLKMWAGSASV
jgi:hypothetical protein